MNQASIKRSGKNTAKYTPKKSKNGKTKVKAGNSETGNKYTTEMVNKKPRSWLFERTNTTGKGLT